MSASHVAGGGLGSVLGAVVVAVLHRYFHVSDVDSALVGSAAVSAGVGLGHVVGSLGVVPAVKRLIFGKPKA